MASETGLQSLENQRRIVYVKILLLSNLFLFLSEWIFFWIDDLDDAPIKIIESGNSFLVARFIYTFETQFFFFQFFLSTSSEFFLDRSRVSYSSLLFFYLNYFTILAFQFKNFKLKRMNYIGIDFNYLKFCYYGLKNVTEQNSQLNSHREVGQSCRGR